MIMPHSTGHVIARDGCLLRVDIMAGGLRADSMPISLLHNRSSAVTKRCTGRSRSGYQHPVVPRCLTCRDHVAGPLECRP